MDAALPSTTTASTPARARWRINLTYWWRHGRLPDLDDPRTFTELIQARKLDGADAQMTRMADKLLAKQAVGAQIGHEWLIPTLWQGTELPATPAWPTPFVVKARHGCNQTAFVLDHTADWTAVCQRAERWMETRYGYWLDEDAYAAIPRGLIVEPFMGTPPTLPVDYKCYVFGGRVEYVQVHLGRGGRHRWVLFDRLWRRVSTATADPDPARPLSFLRMIAAAERLAGDRDFVRVDLYEIDGTPLFGEMTFYPGSGLDRFDPVALDRDLGAHWRRVLADGPVSVAA